MNKFSYTSEQVHSFVVNGKSMTRKHSVAIKNGKGSKSVEYRNGSHVSSKTKRLTQTELNCIKRHKFIPGLFKDCIKPLRINGKTRRNRNK